MADTAVTVHATTTLGEVARRMQAAGVDSAIVLDARDQPIGVITERHLLQSVAASRNPDVGTAESWMNAEIVVRDAGAKAGAAR